MSSKIIPNKNVIEVYSRGMQGASAYAIAVNNGYLGTEEEWLASLRGPKGDPLRYSDLTAQQKSELIGPQGVPGATGAPGKAFTMVGRESVTSMQNTAASEGDFIVITEGADRGDLYKKVKGNWVKVLNIIGPTGIGEKGDKGDQGVSITDISQITESTLDNGINVIRITLDSGAYKNFFVRNGTAGSDGRDGYTIIPYVEGTVLKWLSPAGSDIIVPADMDLQTWASNTTSALTNGLEPSPIDVFESNLDRGE